MASPRVSRPPDSRSRDAACLASRAVLRSGPITTMVTSRARVVTAAAADRAANGSTLRYTIRSSTPRLANGPWSARRAHSRIPVPSAPGVVVGSPTPTSIARSSPPLDQFWCAEREPSYGEVCLPRTWGGSGPDGPPQPCRRLPRRAVRTDMTKAALIRRRFARRPEEVAAARRFVRGGLTRGSEAWETAQLLVSETVTSSLDQSAPTRGAGTLEVGYAVVGRRLRVEVSDDGGPARLRRRIHAVRSAGGRGLELVRALASRWGVRESAAGRTIWFEVDITGGSPPGR